MLLILSDPLQFTFQCDHAWKSKSHLHNKIIFTNWLQFLTFDSLIRFHGRTWFFLLPQIGRLDFKKRSLNISHMTELIGFPYQNAPKKWKSKLIGLLWNHKIGIKIHNSIPWYRTSTEAVIWIVVCVVDLMIHILQNGLLIEN